MIDIQHPCGIGATADRLADNYDAAGAGSPPGRRGERVSPRDAERDDEDTMKIAAVVTAALAAAAATPSTAPASQLIARNATNVRLEVNRTGKALITYRSGGELHRVLAWGAVDARPSTYPGRQVAFAVDYSGGWGSARRLAWKAFENACTPVRVPLQWVVAACRARDGSFWALQSWQRTLPVYGMPPAGGRGAWELRLSHWTGALPKLEIHFGWTYGRYHQIYGRLTWRGMPVYGRSHTPSGAPLDDYGRNIYVDTLNSAYGPGWRRENGFLTHEPTGGFCYGFYPHGNRPTGRGERYRATVVGPGVTPDVFWQGTPPATYDRAFDERADRNQQTLLAGDPLCPTH
jgi:hypothetical protein